MKDLPKMRVVAIKKSFKKAKKPRERLRYHALWLLTQGYKRKEVESVLDISESSLGTWVSKYNKYGLSSLKDKPQIGNCSKLTRKQRLAIKKLISKKTPGCCGYKEKFWSIKTLKKPLRKNPLQLSQ